MNYFLSYLHSEDGSRGLVPWLSPLGEHFLKVLILNLLRFETLVSLLFVASLPPSPVSCFTHVNSCGHFLLKVMRFSPSGSKPHFLELLNSEIGNPWALRFPLPRSWCCRPGGSQPRDWEHYSSFTKASQGLVFRYCNKVNVCLWPVNPGFLAVFWSSCFS